jgi:transcriptional regulator with XRE-family HTH domain
VEDNRYESILKMIGKNIRTIRNSKGLSMEALANEANIEFRQLGRIERGEGNTTVASLVKIADALKVDVGVFFLAKRTAG